MVPTQLRELENRPCMTWIGPVLTEALGAGSPILRSFQAGEAPSFYVLATAALVQHGLDHPDRYPARTRLCDSVWETLIADGPWLG